MKKYDYEIKLECGPYQLLRRSDGKWTVVSVRAGQVHDEMPGDAPTGGGEWFAAATPTGITYVASGYSESWAREVFSRKVENYREAYPSEKIARGTGQWYFS